MVKEKEKKKEQSTASFWLVFIPLSLVNFPCRVYMYASLFEIWLWDENFSSLYFIPRETSLHIHSLTHSHVQNNPFHFSKIKKFLALFLFVFLNQPKLLLVLRHTHILRDELFAQNFRRSHSDFVFEQWKQKLKLAVCVCVYIYAIRKSFLVNDLLIWFSISQCIV